MSTEDTIASSPPARSAAELRNQRVYFAGKLASMGQREAQQLLRQHGAVPVDALDGSVDLLVVGDDAFPLGDSSGSAELIEQAQHLAQAGGRPEIIPEAELWQWMGLVDAGPDAPRLYTPAMLAELLGVSVAVVRRWRRAGLIVPVREVRRLAYYDFQEVTTARRLAELLAAGDTPQSIAKKLAALRRVWPHVERPLAQLSVLVEGRQLLLREGDGLLEPGGQRRFDFQAAERPAADRAEQAGDVLSIHLARPADSADPGQLRHWAAELDDAGQTTDAVEMYRAALAAGGPDAETCFLLAELLYRLDDLPAARERYFMAIELNEDYVEARANLGCVLAELGERELAVAAFEGALSYHAEYPDVHYHLARTLDELGRGDEAARHWRTFLDLAADSPWADEARRRLDR
jgi:tetratricopeptide (TPR) repeat protein